MAPVPPARIWQATAFHPADMSLFGLMDAAADQAFSTFDKCMSRTLHAAAAMVEAEKQTTAAIEGAPATEDEGQKAR